MNDLKNAALILDQAAFNASPVEQLSNTMVYHENQAYEIQQLSLNMRYERGEKFSGLKMGFTSYAKMEQMGVHDMIWGRLTDKMAIENNGSLHLSKFIHPRAEPEICFRISQDIDREIELHEVMDYVDGIAPAIEIIDSRYKNFKFSLEDVIADNCSSAAYLIGSFLPVTTSIQNLRIDLVMNGLVKESGNSDDILGNPWLSLCNASRLAVKNNQAFPKGSILLAGAATAAFFIESGQRIEAHIQGMESIGFTAE